MSQAFISCQTVPNFKNYKKTETNHVRKITFLQHIKQVNRTVTAIRMEPQLLSS